MMKQHVTEASLQESYKALGLQLMVSKKIILWFLSERTIAHTSSYIV